MKRLIMPFCVMICAILLAAGCAAQPAGAATPAPTATPTPVPTMYEEPTSPSDAMPTGTVTPEATEPPEEQPLPMKINCTMPAGFTGDTDNSTETMSVYTSDVAIIKLGYAETTAGTSTPDTFKKSILLSLPKEPFADGFQLISCEAAAFESYPGFVVKWTTGANEDLQNHEAHFILTDGYSYRAEYAVSADAADDKAAESKAFFNSVKLTDAQ